MDDHLSSRFQGAVLGLAIGDALGRPTEFLGTLDEIREKFGPAGVTDLEADGHPPGTYTDDTQMSLAVARALIWAGHSPPTAGLRIWPSCATKCTCDREVNQSC